VATLQGEPTVGHSSVARFAYANGRLILWSVASDQIVAILENVDAAEIADDLLATDDHGVLSLRAASDASVLGTVDVVGAAWGLARDGSYAWVADGTSLRIYETNGALRWELLGDYSGASVLPLPTAVHVYAPALGTAVQHVDAVTMAVTQVPFAAATTFGGWFYDNPRFWTVQFPTYRLYEADGTQIAFVFDSAPTHGYGDFIVRAGIVASINDPTITIVSATNPKIYGAAILGGPSAAEAQLIRLDQPVPTLQPIVLPCCNPWDGNSGDFAFANGDFVWSGTSGQVYDDELDALTFGEVEFVDGSISGRLAVATSLDRTWTWDVAGTCAATPLGSFARVSAEAELSGNGALLVTAPQVAGPLNVLFYELPGGALVGSHWNGLSSSSSGGLSVSHTGNLVGSIEANTGTFLGRVNQFPGWAQWAWTNSPIPPATSPDGTLAALNFASSQVVNATFEGTNSTVHDGTGPVAVIDGVAHGFVDDDTLLVSHYDFVGGPNFCLQPGLCDVFVSADVVDALGVVIAPSPIPDPRGFSRISSTEVFLPNPPAIYEIYTGDLLWSGAPGPAAPVGPNHVVHMVNGVLVLTHWR